MIGFVPPGPSPLEGRTGTGHKGENPADDIVQTDELSMLFEHATEAIGKGPHKAGLLGLGLATSHAVC